MEQCTDASRTREDQGRESLPGNILEQDRREGAGRDQVDPRQEDRLEAQEQEDRLGAPEQQSRHGTQNRWDCEECSFQTEEENRQSRHIKEAHRITCHIDKFW